MTQPDLPFLIFPLFTRLFFFFSFSFVCSPTLWAEGGIYEISGAGEVRYALSKTKDSLDIRILGAGVDRPDQAVFVALSTKTDQGSPLIPPAPGKEGSTVWLPFAADLLLVARRSEGKEETYVRRWEKTQWGARESVGDLFSVEREPAQVVLHLADALLTDPPQLDLVIYLKDLAVDNGGGRFYGAIDRREKSGLGERAIRHYLRLEFAPDGTTFTRRGRTTPEDSKIRIYQLLPRLFGNTNERRRPNGSLGENGTGKFSDLDEKALTELKAMGFTHLLITGVLQQVTATDYGQIGEPADDSDLLKGVAGSPYAVRDFYDVTPDYADDPAARMEEFMSLVDRVHTQEMKILIDFTPSQVGRSYLSSNKEEPSLGAKDTPATFFDVDNNFFYLTGDVKVEGKGPPLKLPTVDGDGRPTSPTGQVAEVPCNGLFEGETNFGRVTGNNVVSWEPGLDTAYEMVKLNYGYDFTDPEKATRQYPHGAQSDLPLPDTWEKMDKIIAHWQAIGVDGFRAAMAQRVPSEFWDWLLNRSRQRNPQAFWIAEASDDDPAKVPSGDSQSVKVTGGNAMLELLKAGFDAVHDHSSYATIKGIYDGTATANDLDKETSRAFLFDNALRYAENDAEVRLASPREWGGHGMQVGRPVSALLFGLSRGPVMVYHGQEVGEPAVGAEGFGGDDGRTTIYDYWSMPEFVKWVNHGEFDGGRLSPEQLKLRDFYRRLLLAIDQPAFRDGGFYPLNPDNLYNAAYGRSRRGISGQWLYSYLRYDPMSGQRMLVVVNLNPEEAIKNIRIRVPVRAMRFLDWDTIAGSKSVPIVARDCLGDVPGEIAEILTTPAEMQTPGFLIKELQPLTPAYYQLDSTAGPAPLVP